MIEAESITYKTIKKERREYIEREKRKILSM